MDKKMQDVPTEEFIEENEIMFTLSNDLTFGLVMQDYEICRGLLERIFPERKIKGLNFCKGSNLQLQKTITTGILEKGIRMDVLFEDEDAWYDIEMQRSDIADLPKRNRYYSSAMDIDQIARGDDYSLLKKHYVIFICTFDYFKKNKAIYRFQNYDVQNDLPLGDDSYKIIINTCCPEETTPRELRAFFAYVNNMKVTEGDEFITKVHERVKQYNTPEWRRQMMTLEQEMRRREKIERQEGLAEGIKGLIEICQELNVPREVTFEKVSSKFDLPASETEEYLKKYWK